MEKVPILSLTPTAMGVYDPPDGFHSKETVTLSAVPFEVRLPFRVA